MDFKQLVLCSAGLSTTNVLWRLNLKRKKFPSAGLFNKLKDGTKYLLLYILKEISID
jgi:hypothetical protein